MSALVDVLAALDRQLEFTAASDYSGASDDHRDLLAARDAVADLIEAARRVDRLYPKHWDRVDGGLIVFKENVAEFDDAFAQLCGALSSVGAAS